VSATSVKLPSGARKEGMTTVHVSDGRYLTRKRLVTAVRSTLQKAGFDCTRYCRHSFRIGAATTGASRGMEDAVIKTPGRWRSLAYLEHVKIPREQLANYSNMFAS